MVLPLFGLAAVVLLGAPTVSCTSGSLSVLAMNVAGLPAWLNNNDVPGDKATNSAIVGSRFAQYGYDVIHVQEDFHYHSELYSGDKHTYRTSTSGDVPVGSGLNTLANYDWTEFERIKWNKCSDASGWDCLTLKGFTFMRLSIDDGVSIDLYNLHTDAGTENGDEDARNSNVQQVVDYISSNSVGNAVIVFGDTNSRYSRTADNIAIFTTQSGLTDAWVLLENNNQTPLAAPNCDNPSTNNTCETVDKVFFRSNSVLNLTATNFDYESAKFLNDGSILSDHNPIQVNFNWTLSSTWRQTDLWGGDGGSSEGTWFNDLDSLANSKSSLVSSLTLSGGGGSPVAIGLTLGSGQVLEHGQVPNSQSQNPTKTITMGESEFWLAAKLCSGRSSGSADNNKGISYVLATTTEGRTVAIGDDAQNANCKEFNVGTNWQIMGLLGREGNEGGLNQLGFIYGPT